VSREARLEAALRALRESLRGCDVQRRDKGGVEPLIAALVAAQALLDEPVPTAADVAARATAIRAATGIGLMDARKQAERELGICHACKRPTSPALERMVRRCDRCDGIVGEITVRGCECTKGPK
jgi:hypothetical protein